MVDMAASSEGQNQSRKRKLVEGYWPLLVIIALFILLTTFSIWLVPPYEGPDEPEHFAYITWLSEDKGFPPQGDAAWETPIRQEAGQSPLYYLIASIAARLVDLSEPEATFRSNPHFVGPLPRTIPDNDNRAIHYPSDAIPLAGGWLALYMARSLSLVFGVLLLIGVYGLGRQFAPDTPQIAIAATALVAVTPQIIFISGVASNDMAAAALSAITLWQLAALLRQGITIWRALAVGVAFGLAILFKASAVALALPIAATLFWLWLSRQQSLSAVLRASLVIALATTIVAGWWLARNWAIYGSPLGLGTHDKTPWAITDPAKLAQFHRRWMEVFRSYWLALGWGTIRPEDYIYFILLGLTLVALAGLILAMIQRWRQAGQEAKQDNALIFILSLAILAVAFGLEVWMRRVIATHGRLMFPAAAAITVLLVSGWYSIHPKLPYLMVGLLLLLTLLAPSWLVRPAYAQPEPLTPEAIAELKPVVGWRFGLSSEEAIAELISIEPLQSSLTAGNNLPVRVCWRVLAQTERPYSVLVHIIGPENKLVANRRTYPGLGRYPTTIWQPETVFCDLVQVPIPKTLDETLVYQIEIGMIDQEEGKRLLAFDEQGTTLPATFIDRVRLVSLDPAESFTQADGSAEAIQLADYDVARTWQPGKTYDLNLVWGVAMPVGRDYQVFVHLRDIISGENAAQADGPPLDGWYPTSWWPAGEIIRDDRLFSLPVDTPPGIYQLFVGFYDLTTGERYGSEHSLGEIEVLK